MVYDLVGKHVTSSILYHILAYSGTSVSLIKIKLWNLMMSGKRNSLFCVDGIEKTRSLLEKKCVNVLNILDTFILCMSIDINRIIKKYS